MIIERLGPSNFGKIADLVEIDKAHYGKYGADQAYFEAKTDDSHFQIFLVLEESALTGFAVIELMSEDRQLTDFADNSVALPSENWIHIIAFTTRTNFEDVNAVIVDY